MPSFALEHKRRVTALEQAAQIQTAQAASYAEKSRIALRENSDFAVAVTAIESDCVAMSGLLQGEQRLARKRELIHYYLPLVDAYESEGVIYDHPSLVQLMIWAFDVGDQTLSERFLTLAIAQNQPMPERYSRNIRTFAADMWLEAAALMKGDAALNFLREKFARIKDWPIHDIIKSKYTKQIAKLCFDAKDYERSRRFFELTLSFNSKAKIATALTSLNKFSPSPSVKRRKVSPLTPCRSRRPPLTESLM